jgi:hypothetical protein
MNRNKTSQGSREIEKRVDRGVGREKEKKGIERKRRRG